MGRIGGGRDGSFVLEGAWRPRRTAAERRLRDLVELDRAGGAELGHVRRARRRRLHRLVHRCVGRRFVDRPRRDLGGRLSVLDPTGTDRRFVQRRDAQARRDAGDDRHDADQHRHDRGNRHQPGQSGDRRDAREPRDDRRPCGCQRPARDRRRGRQCGGWSAESARWRAAAARRGDQCGAGLGRGRIRIFLLRRRACRPDQLRERHPDGGRLARRCRRFDRALRRQADRARRGHRRGGRRVERVRGDVRRADLHRYRTDAGPDRHGGVASPAERPRVRQRSGSRCSRRA